MSVDFRHFPADCPRKRSVLRLLKSEESELCEDGPEQEVEEDGDFEHEPVYEEGNVHGLFNLAQTNSVLENLLPLVKD